MLVIEWRSAKEEKNSGSVNLSILFQLDPNSKPFAPRQPPFPSSKAVQNWSAGTNRYSEHGKFGEEKKSGDVNLSISFKLDPNSKTFAHRQPPFPSYKAAIPTKKCKFKLHGFILHVFSKITYKPSCSFSRPSYLVN